VTFPKALRSHHRLPICTCGDLGWKTRDLETRLGARIVSYADDYVICCKGTAEQAMTEMRRLMTQLKLTINEAKTDIR
jgi:RNA-directed DNA polymerase